MVLALLAMAIGVGVATMPGGAGAEAVSPLAVFELDGNAFDSNANNVAPDDWSTLVPTDNSPFNIGAPTFVHDGTGALDDGFKSTSDSNDLNSWNWESNGVTPAKDDIADAFAAAYAVDTDGQNGDELLLYFGQDRQPDVPGTASAGFWFFQNEITLSDVVSQGGKTFNGLHAPGDILVTADLENGGNVPAFNVFKWDPVNGGNDNLTPLFTKINTECGTDPSNDACIIANSVAIDSPWTYPAAQIPSPYFIEGFVNITKLLGGTTGVCFSSFMATSRTSASTTAQSKDFALGSIDTCGSIVIKKVTDPPGATTKFDFTSNVAGHTAFQLAHGESETMGRLNPGTYTVSETTPGSPWSFDTIECAIGSSYVTRNGSGLSIALPLLGRVECTYYNEHDKGSLKITKSVTGDVPPSFSQTFSFDVSCTLAGNPTLTFENLLINYPASSFVTQTGIPTGYSCSVSEDSRTGVDGYTWGTAVFTGNPQVITAKDTEYTVAVENPITRDTGTLKVEKRFVNAPEGSKVTLQIKSGQSVVESGSRADGGSISKVVAIGTYVADEVHATGDVDLALYTASVICTKPNGEGTTTVAQNPDGANVSVAVGKGDVITCTITNTRKDRSITVEKTVSATSGGTYVKAPDVATMDEPGGTFFFRVKITNTSVADTITVTSLADLVAGEGVAVKNLVCGTPESGNGIPFSLAPGASVTCTFTHDLIGSGGATETDHVDVTWSDQEGTAQAPKSSNDAIIALIDLKPTISITKTANPTQVQDSGLVTFTAVVTNTSKSDSLNVDTLTDSIYGNLITGSTKATCSFGGNVVALPYKWLAPGESLVCTFQATVSQTETDTVTTSGTDEEGNRTPNATDDATVTVTHTPPPPPPAPKTDVAIQKDATAQVTLGSDNKATIVYDIRVNNNGPDPAANVTVSDAAPSGVTFSSVAQQPSQGSCSIQSGGAVLSCSLGTLVAGQSVAIKVNATVTVTGTITNTATTTTTTPETNPANNTDSAQTLVVAPVKPPVTPKPPVVAPEICNTVTVTPKMLKGNGKSQKITVKVTQGKKGVAGATIKITGPGISKIVKSGKNGKASVTVTPKLPGIIRVEIQNKKACNTQRIGVVGVYEPPVTG